MELEAAFIEWLRAEGHEPSEGVDAFFDRSEFVRTRAMLIDDSEKEQVIGDARRYLRQRSKDPTFAGQFPQVHVCTGPQGRTLRYTLTVTLADDGAEWIGRVWDEDGYRGEIHGAGSGSHQNYMELARSHVEAQILAPGNLARSER